MTNENSEEASPGPIQAPKENNPPLSTKHSTQPPKLVTKEIPLVPSVNQTVNVSINTSSNNMMPSKVNATTISKSKIQLAARPQASAAKPVVTRINVVPAGHNPGFMKNEPLKVKLMAAAGDGKEQIKRNVTPTRKFK